MLKDFNKVADMPQDVIDKYQDQVPSELLQIWQEDGLGTFLDGYLKVINPDDYSELVKETYFRGESSVPMFVTAFGDIIVLEKNGYIDIIQYKDNTFHIVTKKMSHFLMFILDTGFTDDYFELPLYHEAVEKHGELDHAQCFGFVPLLALGGFKDVDHLDKVKILEHLYLISELVGGIGMDK